MKRNLFTKAATLGMVSCLATSAFAADATGGSTDDSLTKFGITFYGTIDVGVAYETHGTPNTTSYPAGMESLISKNSNNAMFSLSPNNASQSKVGLKGSEDLVEDLSAIFKLETHFNPVNGTLADGPGSVAQNNNVPLNQQSLNADSNRAGEFFNGAAYGGLSSKSYGTLTFGRQTAIMADNVNAYDPISGANAFSVIAYSGTTSGMGDTEDARFDNSLKYMNTFGPARVSALYKFGNTGSARSSAYEANVGTDYAGFSVDAHFGLVKDAIAVSADPNYTADLAKAGAFAGAGTNNSLNATISDNTTWALLAKYVTGPLKLYAAWEFISYANPSSPVAAGSTTIGNYVLGVTNNSAFNNHKHLNVIWAGTRYSISPSLELAAAWYHYSQNSYAGNGCSDNSSAACSGSLNAVSMMIDETINKHFDVYAGAMYSSVSDGLAAGYLYTNTIDPAIGARLNF